MSLTVVKAALTDVVQVQGLLEGARQWLLSKGINQWPYPITNDWLAKRISEREVYLASASGLNVGTVTIQWSDEEIWGEMPDDAGYIHQIAIRRDFGGRGLGLELLGWAETRIASQNKQFARLDCWSENPKLCAYYANAGYVIQRTVTTKYGWSLEPLPEGAASEIVHRMNPCF
jgi:ribosomal protein S18 acetylase RimI-like enzyme